MVSEWDLQNPSEVVLGLEDFDRHAGRWIDGFEGVHGEYGISKKILRKEDYLSFVMKKSCTWQIHGLKRRSREK